MSYSPRSRHLDCDYHDEDKMRFGCYAEFEGIPALRYAVRLPWPKCAGTPRSRDGTCRDSSIRALDKESVPEMVRDERWAESES